MQRWRSLMAIVMGLSLVWIGSGAAAIAINTLEVFGTTLFRAQLLTNQAAVTDGEWIDVSGMAIFGIDIRGLPPAVATVQVRGSNELTRPADNTHGNALGPDITAEQFVIVTAPIRWIKVRVSAYTSGTINAWFEGRNRS